MNAEAAGPGPLGPTTTIPARSKDPVELAHDYLGLSDVPLVVNVEPPSYAVGRTDTFWVARYEPPSHFQIEAQVRLVSRHAYWYVQRGIPVADAALEAAAQVFESSIYPSVRRVVGGETFPGIDNDPRITILHGDIPGVAGYVSSSDAYPRPLHPFSNEREMVYVNVRAVQPPAASYLSVLAHEFTHLVHWNVSQSEDTWIKEGLAELVASLVVPERRLSSRAFLAQPDVQLTAWTESPGRAEHYESASLFLKYVLERYGEEGLADLVGRDPTRGSSLSQVPGLPPLSELFQDWVVANLGDLGPSSRDGRDRYRSSLDGSPRTQSLRPPARVPNTVAQFGTDYYELEAPGQVVLRFHGSPRVPSIGIQPRSGQAMWHGGRADSAVAVMSRGFDLSGLDRAELRYWLWYDIEKDYDYAYVTISRDGRTWGLLEAPGMTRANPTGNNLGVGYTGKSGGGPAPQWTQETIDLRPYVGGSIWVRFSYVTDDAVTREGIIIDDVEIEAIGYSDGAEGPATDWHLEGWATIGAELIQDWAVQIGAFSNTGAWLERLPVDASGEATWSAGGRPVDRAVAAVSGLTPGTTEKASYTLELARQQ